MLPKLENYNIGYGLWFYIEDHQDGKGGHFFPESAKARYRIWRGGSGGAETDSLEEARAIIWSRGKAGLEQQIEEHKRALLVARAALRQLDQDPQLEAFRVEEDWTPVKAEEERRAQNAAG